MTLNPTVILAEYNGPAMIVDSAVYVDGKRTRSFDPDEALEACRRMGGFAWVQLYEPTPEELHSVAQSLGLPEMLVEEANKSHQRPKLQQIKDILFVVLKSARYLDKPEAVELGETHLFLGPDFALVIRYGGGSSLQGVPTELEEKPDLLRRGPASVLYAIVERVVEDYDPVVEGLENDIDEIEAEVFGGNPDARRIYELSREVLAFRRAVQPLPRMLEHLISEGRYGLDTDIGHHLQTVHNQALRISEQTDSFRELLSNILNVNLTLVSVQQNVQVQKISAWAAILVVPTIITGVYGMNFRYMPELSWLLGYPFALLLMIVVSALLYLWFRRYGWL